MKMPSRVITGFVLGAIVGGAVIGGIATANTTQQLGVKVCVDKGAKEYSWLHPQGVHPLAKL